MEFGILRLDGHRPPSDDGAKVVQRAFQNEKISSRSANGNAPRRFLIILGSLFLSALLFALAFAPFGLFFLAWIALVPWLLVVYRASTTLRAFLWSWMAGILFFSAKLWWIAPVNVAGMIALIIYCGLYWGICAWIIRGCRLLQLHPAATVPAVAAVWAAGEFVRSFLFTGFPMIFIGDTQTPLLPICQMADSLGVWGVSFWVVALNALAALILIRGFSRQIIPAIALVAILTFLAMGYGVWRMGQPALSPGPEVLVVQSNDPQTNKGEKPRPDSEVLSNHLDATERGISRAGQHVDLAVWSETILPPLNRESRREFIDEHPIPVGADIAQVLAEVPAFARDHQIGILSGARFYDQFSIVEHDGDRFIETANKRNSAYLFQPDGSLGDRPGQRYDKIHLVPFGEYIPFKHSIPILYKLFLYLGPDYYSDYELQDGSDNGPTVFNLQNTGGGPPWRFVTPICFEDADARLCAEMFRPGADGKKRADFMVNITNDGWFPGDENAVQLQAAVFRCIENRAPMARSVNTGISGFIDSRGRLSNLLPVRTDGTSSFRLSLDNRLTLYTRWGDWFAWSCVILTCAMMAQAIRRHYIKGIKA